MIVFFILWKYHQNGYEKCWSILNISNFVGKQLFYHNKSLLVFVCNDGLKRLFPFLGECFCALVMITVLCWAHWQMEKLQQKTLTKHCFFPQAPGLCWAHGSCKYGDARPTFWFCQTCAVTKMTVSQPSCLVITAPRTGVSSDRRNTEPIGHCGHDKWSSAALHPGLSAGNSLCQNQPRAPLWKWPVKSASQGSDLLLPSVSHQFPKLNLGQS